MFWFFDSHLKTPLIGRSESPIQSIIIRVIREIKHDVYGKRQMANSRQLRVIKA